MGREAGMKLSDLYEEYLAGKITKPAYIDLMHQKHLILFDYYEYIKSTDIESITIGQDAISVMIRGSKLKMLLDKEDSRFIPLEMLNFHKIDPKEMNLLVKIMPANATVFDVGANIGWFTLFFAVHPRVKKVYAFEPIPYTFNYLRKHLALNQIKNAQAFNCGLGDTKEERHFYWTRKETGSSSLTNLRDRLAISKIRCKIITLDQFVKHRQIHVDLIKCDVEGAELFVFSGALETIKRYKPVIYTEMLRKWSKKFGYHPDDIINMLAGQGYLCYGYIGNKIKEISRVSNNLETTNFFFFHSNKHKKTMKLLGV
jgi:FkbM family methyltransferase